MRRVLSLVFEIMLCFLLQTVVFPFLDIGGITPNILLILTVATAYMQGQEKGLYMGLICGIIVDLIGGGLIGLYGIVYMAIGYVNGIAYKIYYHDDYVMPVFLIGLSNLFSGFMVYVFEFLLRGKLNLLFYARRIILPEMLYTVMVSIILYKLLNTIHHRLDHWVKKEVSDV